MPADHTVERIVSGGQASVIRAAALDVAIVLGIQRRDSNGALILTHGRNVEELQQQSNWWLRLGKLCLKLDLLAAPSSDSATAWIAANTTPDRGATQSEDDVAAAINGDQVGLP